MTWPLEQFEDKDVVFVGVGQGRSIGAFQEFIMNNATIRSFEGVDKQQSSEPLKFLNQYDTASTIFVKNEGIPGHDMPVPYVTPMNIFFACAKALHARTVGITGTKGKSTTSALTTDMLISGGYDARLVGNIGNSVFNEITTATQDTVFVLELSSYQLSDIEYSPDIAACVNLYNDHVNWHGSKDAYWQAKRNIIAHSTPRDLFVYNASFPALAQWAEEAQCRTKAIDPREDIDLTRSALFGEHNRLNALLARVIAREFEVPDEKTQQALDDFKPLPHRMEFVAKIDGKIYIDDAIGMTPESTIASIKAITDRFASIGCLLLGGEDRQYDFSELFQLIHHYNIPNLVLFPDTVEKMRRSLPEGYEPEIFEAADMASAVAWARTHAPQESVVLLSTAAPSYSLWKSGFEEKGRQFQENVLK